MRKIMVEEFLEFQAILVPTNLKISRMDYSSRSSRELTLENGIRLHLGRVDAPNRLRRFVQAWHEILKERAADVQYVDLRYKDGFAVRYKQDTVDEDNNSKQQPQSGGHG